MGLGLRMGNFLGYPSMFSMESGEKIFPASVLLGWDRPDGWRLHKLSKAVSVIESFQEFKPCGLNLPRLIIVFV